MLCARGRAPTFDGSTSVVALGEIVDLKLMLYQGMVWNGVTQAELAKRLGTSPTLVSRLLDLDHVSKAEQIRAAMDAIGVRPMIRFDPKSSMPPRRGASRRASPLPMQVARLAASSRQFRRSAAVASESHAMARVPATRELALWRAYERAVFRVFDEGRPITFRIGRTSARLDRLLERHAATRWAHITAWNPSSIPLSKAENERRQRGLVAALKRAGFTALEGDGADPKGRWTPEPTAFVLGIGVREARRLGREHEQLAIVVGQRGKPARLVACEPSLAKTLAKSAVSSRSGG